MTLSDLKAIEEMHEKDIDGRRLYCSRAQKKPERIATLRRQYDERRRELESKTQRLNVYVKNLGNDITDEALRELFSPFGAIVSAKVCPILWSPYAASFFSPFSQKRCMSLRCCFPPSSPSCWCAILTAGHGRPAHPRVARLWLCLL